MYTEDLGSHDSSDRQAVEDVDERLPDLGITSSLTFVVESVD